MNETKRSNKNQVVIDKPQYTVYQVQDASFYEIDIKYDYKLDEMIKMYSKAIKKGQEEGCSVIESLVKHIEFKFNDLGCATYIARMNNNDVIYGRNFDYSVMTPVVVHTNPKDGYASVSVVGLEILNSCTNTTVDLSKGPEEILYSPYLPLEGMNEKGVSMAILTVDDCKTGPTNEVGKEKDIETSLALRMVLDKATSVEEALDLLKQYNMHAWNNTAYHMMIADATGDYAVVEYQENTMQIYKDNEQYRICTNFTFQNFRDRSSGICWRYDKAMEVLKSKKFKVYDEKEGMDVLASIMQYEDNSTCFTCWSGVYDLTAKKLTFCHERNYNKYFEFEV